MWTAVWQNHAVSFHAWFIITHRNAYGLLPADRKKLIFYDCAMNTSLNLKRILLTTATVTLSHEAINYLRLLVDWLFTNTVLGIKVGMQHDRF